MTVFSLFKSVHLLNLDNVLAKRDLPDWTGQGWVYSSKNFISTIDKSIGEQWNFICIR